MITLIMMVAGFVTGVVFADQVKDLIDNVGDKIKGFIKKIRDIF